MRSRRAATYATSSLSQAAPCPPRPSRSSPCHGRAQHTQRQNVVPPLCPNHEHNAQRVMAHVCHALQTPADQPHRHALHLVVLVVGADLPSSQSTTWVLREAAEWFHVCGRSKCKKTTATLTHLRSLHSSARKGGVMGKRNPTHSTRTRAHGIATPSTSNRSKEPCAQHTHGGNKRDGMYTSTNRSPSLLPSPTDWRPTLTVRHGAHHPLPPCALSRPAPSHPRAIAMGSTKNCRSGPSVPLAGKKKE
ncbi:hypothetical protein TcCL_NonESM10199 [Trypanosoma cruzi]|nr:hypothetical protein TcCL_NonESM10199 [Trypanosoma cruzi]